MAPSSSWLDESLGQELLKVVQLNGIYPDSKHFVDMPVQSAAGDVMTSWESLKAQLAQDDGVDRTKHKQALLDFLGSHFGGPGSDVLPSHPPDLHDTPPHFLTEVQPDQLRALGEHVYRLWGSLCRKASDSIVSSPMGHTLLPLPHPFFMPGDRFRECYNWDSLWIVKGLLASGMVNSAEGQVRNLLSLIDEIGFVPNGARSYYTNRSQPPVISAMVMELYQATHSMELLRYALPRLLSTWQYWTSGRKAVQVMGPDGRVHYLSRYYAAWPHPRPESYREDVAVAEALDDGQREELFLNISSAAESGWDFSSRWFEDGKNLQTIRTTQIAPADLNGFLYTLASDVSHISHILGDQSVSRQFLQIASERLDTINSLLWCEATGCWHDVLLVSPTTSPGHEGTGTCSSTSYFSAQQLQGTYASNWVPMWCGCTRGPSPPDRGVLGQSLGLAGPCVRGLKESGLLDSWGVRTSMYNTGQQWDGSNSWPPLVDMIVRGLLNVADEVEGANELAGGIAHRWLLNNYAAYRLTGHMHEKYDASRLGQAGSGGEYAPQVGFGWSNGVFLELLKTFPNQGDGSALDEELSQHSLKG